MTPDRLTFAQQRHAKRGSLLAEPDRDLWIARNGGHIVNMHGAALADGPERRHSARSGRVAYAPVPLRYASYSGGNPKFAASRANIALAAVDHGLIGIAKPRGGLDHRIEHRLQIEGRAADDLQHVAGRGLVFQQFLKIGSCGFATRDTSRRW